MKQDYNNVNFDQLQEEGDNGRLNIHLENNNLFESMEEMDRPENLPTEKIENPSSSINGSTGESDKKEDKNENQKSFNLFPQENEKKMTKVLIVEKKETIIQNNVQKEEKNLNLNKTKEPVESDKMDIEDDMDIEKKSQGNDENQSQENNEDQIRGNDENQSQRLLIFTENQIASIDSGQIQGIGNNQNIGNDGNINSIFGLNQDEQLTDFSTFGDINVNWGGVDYYEINEFNDSPIEDDDRLNSSNLNIFCQIECNHQH